MYADPDNPHSICTILIYFSPKMCDLIRKPICLSVVAEESSIITWKCFSHKFTWQINNIATSRVLKVQSKFPAKSPSLICLWWLVNLPPSIKFFRDKKSVQLFKIFFYPVSPQETVAAANGAQQRLELLVSSTELYAFWPPTHLSQFTANTVISVTLKRCSTSSTAVCLEKKKKKVIVFNFLSYMGIILKYSDLICLIKKIN